MTARHKLNTAYLAGVAIVSGFLGLTFESLMVFVISFGLLATFLLADGSVRLR